MKKFTKILILAVALMTMIGGFAPRVFAVDAVTPLNVQFVPDPLFVKPNFLPLDETSGTATVTNNSGTTQTIGTEAIHVLDNDHFGDLLHLKIIEGSTTLYDNSLSHFFGTAGEYSLGTILNGTSRTFTYTISFINSSDNSYQGKTLGFDVCVGFLGGATHCGGTGDTGGTVGDEDGGTTPGGVNGSSVSSFGSSRQEEELIIFNEQALNIFNVGTSGVATITWDTNLLSTSQVVYGLAGGGPYTLVITPPNFGYPITTREDSTYVTDHSMFLDGLTPGATYFYRVISHISSAPTISPEFEFTVPLAGLVLGASAENNITGGRQGGVLGASTENTGDETSAGNVLGASALPGSTTLLSLCSLIALLILLLIYLVWQLWLRRRYERLGIPEEEIGNRFYLFFALASLLVIIILLILGKYCPLIIFVIVFLISAGFYAYRKLRSR